MAAASVQRTWERAGSRAEFLLRQGGARATPFASCRAPVRSRIDDERVPAEPLTRVRVRDTPGVLSLRCGRSQVNPLDLLGSGPVGCPWSPWRGWEPPASRPRSDRQRLTRSGQPVALRKVARGESRQRCLRARRAARSQWPLCPRGSRRQRRHLERRRRRRPCGSGPSMGSTRRWKVLRFAQLFRSLKFSSGSRGSST